MNAATDAFIRKNLQIEPARLLPEIALYTAHPGSRLRDLVGDAETPPYWAYGWAGGTVLARHLLDRPGLLADRRVLDLGCGSGVVGIAAMKAGAAHVLASDIDPHALAATRLNAMLNAVEIDIVQGDLIGGVLPDVDLVLVGDLFYDRQTAARGLPWLQACRAGGMDVLIGDPFRAHLPQDRLRLVADYEAPDFGSGNGRAGVFSLP